MSNLSNKTDFVWVVCWLAFLVMPAGLTGQAIETDPAFPTEDEPVTIIFDATEAERDDLVGYDGDLYAHTGVIISEDDKDTGAWEYVIGNWGDNEVQPQLSPLGGDRWELEIDEIREFYEVPDDVERIYQLAFVFRSADGNLQTEDLFVDLFDEQIVIRFDNPAVTPPDPYFTELGETIEFRISGRSPAGTLSSIRLFEEDDEIASVEDSDELEFDYTVTSSGRTDFFTVAEDETGAEARDSLYVVVNPELQRESRPAGIEDGITYDEEDTSVVTFSIYAPGKDFVYLIGDFSDWEVRDDYFMKLDEASADSAHFWLTVDGFDPGRQYRFQYFVDGEIRVADLFSELVLDPDFDQYIPEEIYPDLPEYPHGYTDYAVTVIEPGRESYEWQIPDFNRPDAEELVIYELLLRDFLEESSYQALADTLGYLERLGVNAIELMPVSEFDGNISWGYNPTFHGALEKSYGTRRAFKEFVDEAHSLGMAVILDVVYNHAHDKSPLIRTFGQSRNTNPLIGPGHVYNVFFHLNHDHSYIHYWMDRMNRYWLETYNVDGYRFDLTKGFATNVDDRALLDGYNPERIENLKRMADVLWQTDPEAYVILEHFADNQEEIELSDEGMLLWGNHNRNYNQVSMGFVENSNFSGIFYQQRNWNVPNLVGYMESHDEQWMMFRNLTYGNASIDSNYDIQELETALTRQKLAGALFFTVPGPKMIWQFGELGYGGGPDECLKPGDGTSGECNPADPGRTDPKPVRWDYYDDEARNRLYRAWSELIRLRKASPVFSSGQTTAELSAGGLVKWFQLRHDDMDAVVIGNMDVDPRSETVTFSEEGEWYEFVSGETFEVSSTSQSFDLEPGEIRIYTSEFIEPAEAGVFERVDDNDIDTTGQLKLHPNYPNPFNAVTNLVYEVPEGSGIQLEIYDAIGRRVSVIVSEENHPPGVFEIEFNGSGLSSGVYIARLTGNGGFQIQKMVLIK